MSAVVPLLQGAARNRMLVKGGSAFNGLMRAMKQDLVEGGAGAAATRKDPNALYEVRACVFDLFFLLSRWLLWFFVTYLPFSGL